MYRTSWMMLITSALTLVIGSGCRTPDPLPPANFSTPGWHVQSGQAIWKPSASRPEVVGDLLLATNVNGNFFIQYSKIPFPLVMAKVSGEQWQIQFGADQYSWHGRGTPPSRFSWFQFPAALRGATLGSKWQFTRMETNSWRLENSHTGEVLEGEFFP
jgi:hypothetical protein